MKKKLISKIVAHETMLTTIAFRKPHFTGAEINGNRSYALPLSIRDSKKRLPSSTRWEAFCFRERFSPVLL
ncbi:hypothetical protein [Dialister invisus]|uniref:hypothetical protein n=1 Tax=Dialister invisus TaxID=218538 RepID=UPI00307A4DC0